MALKNPTTLFGIHSATFYERATRKPIAFLRVLGDATMDLSGDTEELMGGSSMFPWDSQASEINSEISFTAREYPISAMGLLLAGQVTNYAQNALGRIDDIENVKGAIYEEDDGIAAVTLSTVEGEEPIEGEYVVVATAATTVDVYALSNIDFRSKAYLDDSLKIATGLVIATDTEVEVIGFGVTITGGSGMIAMSEGDSFRYTVRRKAVTGVKLVVGHSDAEFPEFGCLLTGQKSGSGAITYVDVYRVKAVGMPINFSEKAYSEWDITMKALYDSEKDRVFDYVRND